MTANRPIQVVVTIWGDKYGDADVLRLHRAVARHASRPVRFVCISDRRRALGDDIVVKGFPDLPLPFDAMRAGCRLKLAMFAPGMLDPDLPTIAIDLDTAIIGDVARLVDAVEAAPGLYLMASHYVQWWKWPAWLKRLVPATNYFGNSSLVGFRPRDASDIWPGFCEDVRRAGGKTKHIAADDRYLSWKAGDRLRVFPKALANKFVDEYMAPFAWIEDLRKRLPWVRRRRSGQAALTFAGAGVKPELLVGLRRGDLLRYKRRKLRWDHDNLAAYFREPV